MTIWLTSFTVPGSEGYLWEGRGGEGRGGEGRGGEGRGGREGGRGGGAFIQLLHQAFMGGGAFIQFVRQFFLLIAIRMCYTVTHTAAGSFLFLSTASCERPSSKHPSYHCIREGGYLRKDGRVGIAYKHSWLAGGAFI